MRRVRITIRYYDEVGHIVFEGEPTLGHAYRVPVRWTRWEIYWDEVLVESGERKAEGPTEGSSAQRRSPGTRAGDTPTRRGPRNGGGFKHMATGWAFSSQV